MHIKSTVYDQSSGAPMLVLMFHGVVKEIPKYTISKITRTYLMTDKDFERIIKACAKRYKFLKLSDVGTYLSGEATRPGVLITFDDGLDSVCKNAIPILEKYNSTACVFIAEDWIDSGVTPSIFELEVELFKRLPVTLDIRHQLFSYSKRISSRRDINSCISDVWMQLIRNRVPPLSLNRGDFFFDEKNWSPDQKILDDEFWFPASWTSLQAAFKSGVLEIGAHGKSHTPLTWLSNEDLVRELEGGKLGLEKRFSCLIDSIAYPHGFDTCNTHLAAKKYYKYGFGSTSGFIDRDTNHMSIPRYHVPSESPNYLSAVIDYPMSGRILRAINTRLTNLIGY